MQILINNFHTEETEYLWAHLHWYTGWGRHFYFGGVQVHDKGSISVDALKIHEVDFDFYSGGEGEPE